MEILICVLLGVLFMISGVLWSKYDKEQTKKFLETVPPIGKRYFVKKKTLYSGEEYQKVYFTVIEIYFNFNEDKISEKLIKYFDNEKEAINLRNIYNNRDFAYDTKNKLQDCTDGEIIN